MDGIARRTWAATGGSVHPVGFGAMGLSIQGRPSEAQALATLAAALGAGADLIDTADVYALDDRELGHNERLVREALRQRADDRRVIVATKGGCTRPDGRWGKDARPARLRAACERSLRALGVERLDLYQLHAPDPRVPFLESVGELARLREEGKVAHVGLSNVSLSQIEAAEAVVPIASVQNRLSFLDTTALRDGVVARCEARGQLFLAWSPLGGRRGVESTRRHPTLAAVAARLRASPAEVALAWLLAQSPAIVPLPGSRTAAHARGGLRAASLSLSPEDLAALDRAAGRM